MYCGCKEETRWWMVFYAGEYINVKGYTYAPYARDMKPAQLKKKN